MHKVEIKRKGFMPERYFSEGTAIQDGEHGRLVTLTAVVDGEKQGLRFMLTRGDKVTITDANTNPKRS